MKKIVIYLIVTVFAASAIFYSCAKKVEKENQIAKAKKSLFTTVVGTIENSNGNPEMTIPFEEAVALIKNNNKLVDKEYSYSYTEAWIATLTNNDGSKDYYLASRADVFNQNGENVYGCYTHYFKLMKDKGDLIFSPGGGTQHTCTGSCCSSCELQPADESHPAPWCKCQTPANTPDCQGKARCDHSVTIEM